MVKYIAEKLLWSLAKETYTQPGQEVDTGHWTPDDIRQALERGDIRAVETQQEENT